jgi:hypothetical protein
LQEKPPLGDSTVPDHASDSGVVSPTVPPVDSMDHHARKIRSTSESQCSDEAGDFDTASAHSATSSVTSPCATSGAICPSSAAAAESQTALSDSGRGSEADEAVVMAYNFYIPTYLCGESFAVRTSAGRRNSFSTSFLSGKLIGCGGQTVKHLKAETKCTLNLRHLGKDKRHRRSSKQYDRQYDNPNELQVCELEGTRAGIDKCLDLIREK